MNAFSRISRQIFISGIFFILLFGTSYLIYRNVFPPAPVPLCVNGVKDIGEEGIDCGGSCDKICPPPSEVVKESVEWAKAVASGVNSYDLVAKINNSNKFWGIKTYNYRFTVKDKNNAIVLTKEGSSYLLPEGYDYVIIPSQVIDSVPRSVDFEISDEVWGSLSPEYTISSVSLPITGNHYTLKDENSFPSASGYLTNKTLFDFDRIDIKVALFGADGELLGVNVSNMNTVQAGEERYFRTIWNMAPTKGVDHMDFKATTNVFNSKNFMKRYGTDETFKEYR